MRRFKNLSTVLGVTAALTVAAASSAQAAPAGADSVTSYSDCPTGWFCVWDGPGGTGAFARFQTGAADLRAFDLNDKISSLWNRTGVVWCTYTDINYGGSTWPVGNWQGNTAQYSRDNTISSLHRGGC
jgi:hypothetical protein